MKDKLADIADNVTTKEQAWKKMAQLLKEGYALPFDYTVGVNQRKTYPALKDNEILALTKADDMKEFAIPEECKAIMAGAKKIWPYVGNDDDDDDDDGKHSAKRRNCIKKPLMPVSLCQTVTRAGGNIDTTPVGIILRELGVKIDDVIADLEKIKILNKGLEEASLDDIKNFIKYCVISRDRHFVASSRKASEVVKELLEYSNSPMKLPVSRYYCENLVNPESRTAVKEMGEILRQTFMNRIERNAWLDTESKAGAKWKLEKMLIQVGWPDRWNESAEATVKDDGSMNTYDLICDWMSPQARETFNSLTDKVVEHYDGWEYYARLRCNGIKTEKENTADMGGLCIAYEALMAQRQGSATEKLYVAREYYRAFAYGWMEKGTPLHYLGYITDNHAPGSLRVNGSVREMDEFYEAFDITDGKMYITPQKRIHIW